MATETEIERLVVRLIGDGSSYLKMLKQAEAATKKTETRIQKLGKTVKKVGESMTRMGRTLTLKVTAPIVALGALAVRSFARFDKAMTESLAIMDVTADQAKRMRELTLSLSGKTVQSPTELAEAYFFLGSAGKNAEQSMALLPIVAKFATAGSFSMSQATDLLTDAQSALGLSSKNVAEDQENLVRLANLLVKANTLANASVEQFSIALTTKAGSAIKSFNLELEDGIALLAAYADQGIKAELAGNALDRLIRLLTKSVEDNEQAFKDLGIKVFQAGEFRKFADIIGDIEKATADMTTRARAAALTQLGFAARVQQVILPLLKASGKIREYRDELKNAGNIMDEVAKKQMKSFSNQMKLLRNEFDRLGIQIGGALAPTILGFTDNIKRLVRWFGNLSEGTKGFIITVVGLLAVLGPLLLIFGKLAFAVGALMQVLPALTAAMAGVGIASKAAAVGMVAFKVAAVAVAAIVVGRLVASLIGATKAQREFNRARLESQGLSAKQSAAADRGTQGILRRAGNISDPFTQQKFLEDALSQAENSLAGAKSAVKTSQKDLDSLVRRSQDSVAKSIRGWAANLIGIQTEWTRRIAEAQLDLDEQTAGLEDTQKRVEAIQAELTRTALGDLDGDGGGPGVLTKEQTRLGAIGKQITRDVEKPLESFRRKVKELTALALLFAKTGGRAGISAQTWARAMAALNKEFKKNNPEAQKQQKFLDEGKAITERFLTPLERFTKRMTELRKQLTGGGIGQDTFNRAAKAAKKTLDDATKDRKVKIRVSLEVRDAAGAGSAEAISRIQSFLGGLGGGTGSKIRIKRPAIPASKLRRRFEQRVGRRGFNIPQIAARAQNVLDSPGAGRSESTFQKPFKQPLTRNETILQRIAQSLLDIKGINTEIRDKDPIDVADAGLN